MHSFLLSLVECVDVDDKIVEDLVVFVGVALAFGLGLGLRFSPVGEILCIPCINFGMFIPLYLVDDGVANADVPITGFVGIGIFAPADFRRPDYWYWRCAPWHRVSPAKLRCIPIPGSAPLLF